MDYSKLNAVAMLHSFSILPMHDCIDSPRDATSFSILYASRSYWQVQFTDENRDKTTFTSHHRPVLLVWMPFGLRIAPRTFQRVMDIILPSAKWQFPLVYFGDVVLSSSSPDEHIDHA